MTESFPKSARLRKKADFKKKGIFFVKGDYLNFSITEGKERLGISISKKLVKKAVSRNKIKRMIREVFRRTRQKYLKYDIHAVYRKKNNGKVELFEIKNDFLKLEKILCDEKI